MKVKVRTIEEIFQPIELVITIENEQDLINLWHRFYLNQDDVNKNTSNQLKGAMCHGNNATIWNKLDDLVIERNLRNK